MKKLQAKLTRARVASGLQILGAGFVSAGSFTMSTVLGCLVLGVSMVVFGVALEREG